MIELKRNLEIRRENLIYLLKNKKDSLEIEKQHQIYGAIKELEYISRMVEQMPTNDMLKQSSIMTNEDGSGRTGMLRKVGHRVRAFKSPIKVRFGKKE